LKSAYIDTNVFVASYKPDDVFYEESSAVIKAMKEGEIKGQTSTLTILETAAVASRTIRMRKGDDEKEVRRRAVGRAIIRLSRLGLRFIHAPGDSSALIDGSRVEMPVTFHQALLLASIVGLRSFDLVHLAAAKYSHLRDSDLGAFVTGDSDFLRRKRELAQVIGMPMLSPKEYVEGLGL
jgi:predicted nucleic acid-binding protein